MVFNFGAPKLIPCFWAVTGKAGNLWGNFHHLWDLVSVTFVWPIVTKVIPELVLRTMFLLVFVYSFAFFCGLVWFGACTKIPQSIVLKYIIHRACDRHPFFEKIPQIPSSSPWLGSTYLCLTTNHPPEIRLNHALWRETNPPSKSP